MSADARTVTDLETTALEAAVLHGLSITAPLTEMDAAIAAVRELARRAEWEAEHKMVAQIVADRDRLQALLAPFDGAPQDFIEGYKEMEQECHRYREALEQIVKGSAPARIPPPWVEDIARAALATPDTPPNA